MQNKESSYPNDKLICQNCLYTFFNNFQTMIRSTYLLKHGIDSCTLHFAPQTRSITNRSFSIELDQRRRWSFGRRWRKTIVFEKLRFSATWKRVTLSNPVSWLENKNKNSKFIHSIPSLATRMKREERTTCWIRGGWKKKKKRGKFETSSKRHRRMYVRRNSGGKKLHSYKIIYEVGQWGREKIVLEILCCWIKLSDSKEDMAGWFMGGGGRGVGQWERTTRG